MIQVLVPHGRWYKNNRKKSNRKLQVQAHCELHCKSVALNVVTSTAHQDDILHV